MRRVADSVNKLVAKIGGGPIQNNRNGWQLVLLFVAILAACFVPLVFTLGSQSDALDKHEAAVGHEGMDGRVHKIEETLHGEDKRNEKIEGAVVGLIEEASAWRADHDRRVLPLNTAQSKKGEELGRLQQIIWQNCMPPEVGPYPTDVSGWPRIEP